MIYLDNNATTPLDPRVLEAMMPYFTDFFGNATSDHEFGIKASDAVKQARKQVGGLLGCDTNELIFTSGATEAINLAIKGVTHANKDKGQHIVTVSTEHSAVLDTCQFLEGEGYEVTYLPVRTDGLIELSQLSDAIRKDTVIVSIMFVNNETGVIQPIREIARIVHEKGALFMTDATQAVGKIPIDVRELGIDLLACSAHKFDGPKGIGVLYFQNRGRHKVKLTPLLHGGGHERGMRSGTLNVPLIVGMGEASEIARKEMKENEEYVRKTRDTFEEKVLKIDDIKVRVNGNVQKRLYNVSNILFEGIDADALIIGLENIMVSTGSACTSMIVKPSHVLMAMYNDKLVASSSIRFSFHKRNQLEIISTTLLDQLRDTIRKLQF
jgi:cysteine desulfurase